MQPSLNISASVSFKLLASVCGKLWVCSANIASTLRLLWSLNPCFSQPVSHLSLQELGDAVAVSADGVLLALACLAVPAHLGLRAYVQQPAKPLTRRRALGKLRVPLVHLNFR